MLAAYDRTNAMALIALSALLHRLDNPLSEAVAPTGTNGSPVQEQRAAIPLPRLLDLTEMAQSTAALVVGLNRFGSRQETPILASMYRHLAHWPAYLALSWTVLAPLDADGRLERHIVAAKQMAALRIAPLAAQLPQVALPPSNAVAAAREALVAFTSDVISKMVVICAVLREVSGDI